MYDPLCVCFRALKGRGLFIHKNCHRGKPCLTVKAVRSKTSNSIFYCCLGTLMKHLLQKNIRACLEFGVVTDTHTILN